MSGQTFIKYNAMKYVYRTLIIAHFSFVILTVSHLYTYIKNPVVSALNEMYSAITYSNRCFGFFAPDVGSDLVVDMKMSDGNRSLPYSLLKNNFEVKTRIYSLGGNFAQGNHRPTMDLFAQSWGLKCLNENPGMKKVTVLVLSNVIPDIKSFSKGARITQDSVYITDVEVK